MKKSLLVAMGVPIAFSILWPSHESLNSTYQGSLWTTPSGGRSFETNARPPELTIRLGPVVPGNKLLSWDRFRLGLPFRAITIDIQPDHGVLQARLEALFLPINLGCGGAIGFVVFSQLSPRLIRRKIHGPGSSPK